MVYNQFMQFLRIYIFEAVLRTLYSVRCTVNSVQCTRRTPWYITHAYRRAML